MNAIIFKILLLLALVGSSYGDDENTNEKPTSNNENSETQEEEEDEETRQQKLQEQLDALNDQTKKAFASTFDFSEDFDFEDMDLYQSGSLV